MTAIRNPSLPTFLFAVAALIGCGGGAEGDSSAKTGDSSGAASTASTGQGCLPDAEVSGALGIEVREFRAGSQTQGDMAVCAYTGTDNTLGVSVTTIVGPASRAEEVFGKMQQSATLFLGASAAPEAITAGERGLAWGGGSKSEAAAVSGSRLYQAEVVSSASANLGDKKAGLTEIVRKLIGQ